MSKQAWLGCLAYLGIAAFIATSASADRPRRTPSDDVVGSAAARRPQFRFARLKYPGGIPDYIKNWYTDYPNMDSNLTTLARRMTIIDVGEPFLVEPVSQNLFNFPLLYSLEPEQM